jgi:dipeptidase
MTYELLTGKVLFNPEKSAKYTIDQDHIYWITEMFQEWPEKIINLSNKKDKYFKNNEFKFKIKEYHNLEYIFKKEDKEISNNLIVLLNKMLNLDYELRPSCDEIILYNL